MESAEVLEFIERASTDQQLGAWREAEAEALAMRGTKISAMDIFDVQMRKGECACPGLQPWLMARCAAPTRMQIQLQLTQTETVQRRHQGVAAWLATGMKIQELQ